MHGTDWYMYIYTRVCTFLLTSSSCFCFVYFFFVSFNHVSINVCIFPLLGSSIETFAASLCSSTMRWNCFYLVCYYSLESNRGRITWVVRIVGEESFHYRDWRSVNASDIYFPRSSESFVFWFEWSSHPESSNRAEFPRNIGPMGYSSFSDAEMRWVKI